MQVDACYCSEWQTGGSGRPFYLCLLRRWLAECFLLGRRQAPRDSRKQLRSLDKGEWKLHNLIEVAANINVLPADWAKAIDQILRDYHNFVHPKKKIRAEYPCPKAEAFIGKGALDNVCNHLKSSP